MLAEAGDVVYVDSSVLIASMGSELYSDWARSVLAKREVVTSVITKVELARHAHRVGQSPDRLNQVWSAPSFVKVDDRVITAAVAVSGSVKALDALHVGTWASLRVAGLDCPFVTADRKQAAAATAVGASVVHPYGEDLR